MGAALMAYQRLRIKITADDAAPFIVMFEPSGMTYELGGSAFMFADIPQVEVEEMEIEHWPGGISIWAPGAVTTLDSDGNELHQLHS
jgi:hypothetical protein